MSSPTEIRADSTENLLQPETSAANCGYLSDAEGNRNRIPLAKCTQQAITTPVASISIDEPHMTISTDEDTEHIAVCMNPRSNTVTDSLKNIPDLEANDRGFGTGPHPLVPYVATQSVPSSDGLTCRHK
jgi:hypothetical protein